MVVPHYRAGLPQSIGPEGWPVRDTPSLFRHTFDEAPHGLLVCAEDGAILFANRLACAILAYDREELIGLSISRVFPESLRGGDPGLFQQFWQHPEARTMAADRAGHGVRRDGVAVPLEVGFDVVATGDARYVIASFVDVTDRLNLEARLSAATDEQLGFQRLVADVAAEFAGTLPDTLDDVIVDRLRQIVEALQLDRAMLWRRGPGDALAVPLHYWGRPPHTSPPPAFPLASMPFVVSKLGAGELVCFSRLEDVPDPIDRESFRQRGCRSALVIPVSLNGGGPVVSGLTFDSVQTDHEWVPAVVERLRLVAGVVSQAIARKASQDALAKALGEIDSLRDQLTRHRVERPDAKAAPGPARLIVSDSPAIQRAISQLEQVANTPATVLLLGETGAGKEVFAQAIHDASPRHKRPMVVVSCAAIPTALIESELFGRERGAYTGALSRQIGRFEAAHQSTLFLDEIGDLPAEMQIKLLRVIQERVIERLGSNQPIKVDVRIIAATNRDLESAVRDGTFREDLFYRLNVFPIVVPPLRDRIEDIPGLVWAFIDEYSRAFGKTIDSISHESLQELQRYAWPGNIRELRNVIERAVILATGHQLVVPTPRPSVAKAPSAGMTLAALEVDHIRTVLDSTNWRIRGRGGAAERLGIKPTTLDSRMARLGIVRKKLP